MAETLTPTAPASNGQQPPSSAPASKASAPAQPDTNQGGRQAPSTAPSAGPADRTPEARLAKRKEIARELAGRSAAGANDGRQAGGGQQGSQAGASARPGDGKPQDGVSSNDTTKPEGTQPGTAQPGAAFTFGKHTGLSEQQFEAAIQNEQRLKRELGAVGSKLAKGEALTAEDVAALADHTNKRAADLAAQGKLGTAQATTQASTGAEGQTPNKSAAQGKAGSGKPPSPGTDGLDAALEKLAFVDDKTTARVRTEVDQMRSRLQEQEAKISEFETREAHYREQSTERNLTAAAQAALSSYPELQQPGVLTAIFDKLEKFDPKGELALAGGKELLELFESAAQLVILPTRLNGNRAHLLERTAFERAGAPSKPAAPSSVMHATTYDSLSARKAIANAINTMPPGREREERIRQIKDATTKG
jgi:hypothetical protein